MIQFEWDLFDLETASLKDYYRLLRGQYELGRLYPSWVDFGPWRPTAENFFGGNYVAVSRRLPELVARLRKRGRG